MATPSPEQSQFLKNAQYVGMVTILYASTEMMVDGINGLILDRFDGKTLGEPLPRATARKIAFLTKAYRRLPLIAPYKEDLATLIGHLRWLKERRHDMIHGAMLHAHLPDITIHRMLHDDDAPTMRVETYKQVDLLVVVKMTLDTFARAFELLHRMVCDVLDEVPEGFREIDVSGLRSLIEGS